MISSFQRKNGGTQATYNGWPLYRFQGDAGKGEATGEKLKQFGGAWYLVTPDGKPAKAKTASAPQAAAKAQQRSPFIGKKFKGSETVRYDAARDRYIVSNINGKMLGEDNNVFISIVKPDGTTELKWTRAARTA